MSNFKRMLSPLLITLCLLLTGCNLGILGNYTYTKDDVVLKKMNLKINNIATIYTYENNAVINTETYRWNRIDDYNKNQNIKNAVVFVLYNTTDKTEVMSFYISDNVLTQIVNDANQEQIIFIKEK